MSRRSKQTSKKRPQSGNGSYEHPVPDRNAILDYLTERGEPVKIDRMLVDFGLKGQRMRSQLVDRLNAMVRRGQVIENRRGVYCLTAKLDLITGTVSGHKDGFGFVIRDDGADDDIYLSAREMRSLFDGDRVAVSIVGTDRRGKPDGKLVEVLERGTQEVVGQFIRERGIGIVIPDKPSLSHRILIGKGDSGGARPGQIVVAEIIDFPTRLEQATGRIVRVLGAPDQKGIATDIAIESHALPLRWPKAVRDSASRFGKSVPTRAKQDRLDLRDLDLVTIDGKDARDFDDAVYAEPAGKGWRVLVAIADVAHYVEAGSPLDDEAIKRGTSVYFPDRVIPMLPEVLSNGLCSLNPKVDRLCMVCEMRVNQDGKVTRSTFHEGVLRSKARLTYSQVNDFLSGERDNDVPRAVRPAVSNLHAVYKLFAKARSRRGALELDLPQTKFELNSKGEIERIVTVPRNDAHRLIEECMIAANVEAAKFLGRNRIQGLYRVHARPDPDRFDELRQYLVSLGLKVPHPEHVSPKQFNQLIEQVQGREDSAAISMQMLRSLQHAEYTPENIGHFGLALDAYAHFTSPIRRYPDLLVHRAVKHIVRGGKAGAYRYKKDEMARLGAITSHHERRAEEATRDVEAWLKCQYMEDHVGDTFHGVVTSVTRFGLFVQLTDLMIDGLVHVTSLPNDYYHFEPGTQRLVGERSGQSFGLGEPIEVRVAKVDMETRRIDFRPVWDARPEERRGNRGKRGRRR
ncbi:MAG: ribonuclease R [Woeseiaceae bacterium]|nr:ribonuclease R [Woeseiaceae bacterium]